MNMNRSWRYFLFLLWISYLLVCGVLLFTRGFLLSRRTLAQKSTCVENADCSGYQKLTEEDPSVINKQLHLDCLDKDQLKLKNSLDHARCVDSGKRVILIVIDALKYEFAFYNKSLKEEELLPFQNKLPIFQELLTTVPNNTQLFKFIANPPTTTMQRLKGLTTGSLPTFIDVGSNFATAEINEDNILDQLLERDKKIVFMGDDTWIGLYPHRFVREYPYPSFNVWDLDTVDSGILNHLKPEIHKKDWSLLIAHFLGVDHCGHTYGPYHPEMSRKLTQMNQVISDIVNTMGDDTLLLVLGDHGMTSSGDHGGESSDEVTSALFVYSPAPFISPDLVPPVSLVHQVDIVPTLSTLLGFAIPFSNLGKVILQVLPTPHSGTLHGEMHFALDALLVNVEQIMLYINTYSRHSHVFSKEKIQNISQGFYSLKKNLDGVNGVESFKQFHVKTVDFLNYVREICEEVWIQFDSLSMSRGLVLTFLLLSFTFFIVEGIPGDTLLQVLESGYLWFAYAIILVSLLGSFTLQHLKLVDDAYLLTYVSTLTISIFTMAIIVVQNWQAITIIWYSKPRYRDCLDVAARGVHLCAMLIVFSNSFVVEEGSVLSFLLNTMVWLIAFDLNVLKLDVPTKGKASDKQGWFARLMAHSRFKSMALALLFMLLLRSSHYFWRCREEQKWCVVAASTAPPSKSPRTSITTIITLCVVALFVSSSRIWLRSCGNLVGFSPTVTLARYAPSVVLVCTGGFWVLQGLPAETRSRLFVPLQLQILPWTVFALLSLGLVSLFLQPLCVYVLERRSDFLSVYGHENIIPQLFHQMKEVMKKSDDNHKGPLKDDSPLVYGLATAYSSVFVILAEFVGLLVILLLGDPLASSVVAMLAAIFVLLLICGFVRLENTLVTVQLFHVPWSYVLTWGLLSSYFFYGTGHQPTFPGIHWYAAFVGTGGQFSSNFLPGLLVGVNTFSSQLLSGLLLPLLLIAPFTLHVMRPSWLPLSPKPEGVLKESRREELDQGELCLYEMEGSTRHAFLKLQVKYLLYCGTRIFACMLAAALHCRHLMVWMIFAPKFIFEALGCFVSLGAVLFSNFLLMRVTHRVDRTIESLLAMRG